MAPLRIIYLLLISSVLWGLNACRTTKALSHFPATAKCAAVLNNRISAGTYYTTIDFGKKHFSGLMVFKAFNNDSVKRVVFISETGFKFFDLEFKQDSFDIKYSIPPLKKKAVINLFHNDLGMLLLQQKEQPVSYTANAQLNTYRYNTAKGAFYVTADSSCTDLSKMEYRKGAIKTVTMHIGANGDEHFEKIEVFHPFFRISIHMNKLH